MWVPLGASLEKRRAPYKFFESRQGLAQANEPPRRGAFFQRDAGAFSAAADLATFEHPQKKRRADKGGQGADGRCRSNEGQEAARAEVGEEEEDGAGKGAGRQKSPLIRPARPAHEVRHDESDKADHPRDRHSRGHEEREGEKEDSAGAIHFGMND